MNSTSFRARLSVPSARWLRSLKTAVALGALAVTGSAHAHPGHALNDADLAHLLTSPIHLAALLLVGGGMLVAAQCVQRRLPRRVLQHGGAVAVAGAAVLWAVRG